MPERYSAKAHSTHSRLSSIHRRYGSPGTVLASARGPNSPPRKHGHLTDVQHALSRHSYPSCVRRALEEYLKSCSAPHQDPRLIKFLGPDFEGRPPDNRMGKQSPTHAGGSSLLGASYSCLPACQAIPEGVPGEIGQFFCSLRTATAPTTGMIAGITAFVATSAHGNPIRKGSGEGDAARAGLPRFRVPIDPEGADRCVPC